RQIELSKSANSIFLDSLNGLRSVRAFSAEGYVTRGYGVEILQYVKTLFRIELIAQITKLAPALLLLVALGVLAGVSSVGSTLSANFPFVVTIVILLLRFFPVVGQALTIALRVIADAKAGRDVTHLISYYEEAVSRPSDSEVDVGPVATVQAQQLGFEHEPGKQVLKDLVLRLEKGKSYAL